MKKFCFLFLCLFGSNQFCFPQNFIKPIDGLPEYNGTYKGSPFTGSLVYTTLYRDNQDNGSRSGCRGEGCGRHPGVDIATPSGTLVKLPLSGVIVSSRCDNDWGGLIVVKSYHPRRSWEYIYQTFAHLKQRQYINGYEVRVGDVVLAGSVIGLTGGRSGIDACSGNSTGAHLHYQIDKDDGNIEPWYPSSNSLNYSDGEYLVSSKTYNPIPMLQGGYKWRFADSSNRELWDIYNWQSWGVSNNALWMDGSLDPFIRRAGLTNCGLSKPCSGGINAEALDYSNIFLDIATKCNSSTNSKIYFTTKDENYWDERKTLSFQISNTKTFRGVVPAYRNQKWQGIITGLRIDPHENCGNTYDPIYFGEIALVP